MFHKPGEFFIARCPATEINTVHTMEENNFLLMDTLLYLKLDLEGYLEPEESSKVIIRKFLPGEEQKIRKIAAKAFSGYYGHYHADLKLESQTATEVYSSWAEQCCVHSNAAGQVLIAELNGKLVGFRAIRMNNQNQEEFVLAGVSPEYQKRGIYKLLVLEGIRWCKRQGAKQIINSTHIANFAVQKVCTRLGFEAKEAYYTFHKWFY